MYAFSSAVCDPSGLAPDALNGRTCKPTPVFGSLLPVWDVFAAFAAVVFVGAVAVVVVVVLDGLMVEVILFFGAFEVDGLAAFGAVSDFAL